MYTVDVNAVILDFDGTIADSFDQVLAFLLKQVGRTLADVSAEEHQRLKGLSMKNLALQVGIPLWRLPFVYFKGRATLAKRMHQTPLFSGIEEVLRTLQAENYQLYIMSSNSRRNINRFLAEHGLGGYFIRVYGSAGWFGKGPALKKALKQNKLEASKTVYVGDEVRDIIGAQIAGMPSVAVNWGFSSEAQLLSRNPTIIVRTPAELQKALVDWGKTN
ncbi:MAG: gph 1 [Candidatus Saccharibacteria bacterium]|nr:gph 1 [Candidatus Saccharibacteria bacterium]